MNHLTIDYLTISAIRVIRLNSCNSFMTYKELFYFTGHCLALDEHPEFREQIIELFASEESNWEGFIQLCSDHLIIPVIYLKFRQHNLLNGLNFPLGKTCR